MAYTTIQICNLALAKVGDEAAQISSLDDGSKEAGLCAKFYEPSLKELLSMHTWNFSLKLASLSASTTDPTFGYDYAYPLPADCIRAVEFRSDSSSAPLRMMNEWRIIGRTIYTNASSAYLIYVSYEIDPNLMPPLFINALYTLLASKLAYPLTEDRQLTAYLLDELNTVVLPEARRINGFEGYTYPRVDSEWIEAGYLSHSAFDDRMTFSAESYGDLP